MIRQIPILVLLVASSTNHLQATAISIQSQTPAKKATSAFLLTNTPPARLGKMLDEKCELPTLFKHPKAIKVRGKVIESLYRQSRIEGTLPLELVQLIEKDFTTDAIDLTFLFNDRVADVNNQIGIINASNNIFQLTTIHKINDTHTFEELCSYLIALNKINYYHSALQSNQANNRVVRSTYALGFHSIGVGLRCIPFDRINEKAADLNNKVYQNERLHKIRDAQKKGFSCKFM